MEISKQQQLSLVREVKLLIDENLTNPHVLERAHALAIVVFGVLSRIDDDDSSVGFALQEYAYNSLHASEGDASARAWIDTNRKALDEAVSAKFTED